MTHQINATNFNLPSAKILEYQNAAYNVYKQYPHLTVSDVEFALKENIPKSIEQRAYWDGFKQTICKMILAREQRNRMAFNGIPGDLRDWENPTPEFLPRTIATSFGGRISMLQHDQLLVDHGYKNLR